MGHNPDTRSNSNHTILAKNKDNQRKIKIGRGKSSVNFSWAEETLVHRYIFLVFLVINVLFLSLSLIYA
jgi:hypothetical protein